MDIKQLNSILTPRQSDTIRRGDTVRGEGAERGRDISGDRVSIDTLSTQTVTLKEAAMQAETDNRARIERLKQAIADGTYEVDTQAIAKKLMQTEALFSTL